MDGWALSPDGQTIALAAGVGEPQKDGGWNEARLYSISEFKELRRWKTHDGQFPQRNAIAFAIDGRTIATGGADHKVRVWDAATGQEMGSVIEPYPYANNVAYLDAQTLMTFGAQSTVKFWDAKSGRQKLDFVGAESHLTALAYSSDGRHVAVGGGGGDATVRVWNAAGKQVAHLRGDMADVTSLQFSPDGNRIVTGDSQGAARLWDWPLGKEIRAFRDHKPWLHSVAFSPDGQSIVTGDNDGVIRLWSVAGDRPIQMLKGHSASVTSLVFSPDGRTLFSGSWDHSIRQWDLGTAKEVRVIKGVQSVVAQEKLLGHTSVVTDLAISADGRRLFSGSYDHRICVWEVSSGRLCRLLNKGQNETNANNVRALALSPDGKQLAAAINDGDGEREVHIWDVLTGEKIGTFAGHRGAVTKLAFAPDGKRLASCSTDTTAIVWDVTALQGPRPELDVMPLVQLCQDLDDADSEKGYAAVCGLAAAGDAAVDLLRATIVTAPRLDLSTVPTLIKQLDDPEFRKREQADQALKKIGLPVEPALRRAMANNPPLEAKRRIERILADFAVEILRQDRALEVLELIGTVNARTRIAELAKGDPDAFLTRAANEALGRLERAKAKSGSP